LLIRFKINKSFFIKFIHFKAMLRSMEGTIKQFLQRFQSPMASASSQHSRQWCLVGNFPNSHQLQLHSKIRLRVVP
jgi:hypothetical protein